MAFKLVAFAALLTVARAGHIGYAAGPVVGHASHGAISTYSTLQHHTPAVHTYAAAAPYAHAVPVAHAAPAAVAYAAPIAKAVVAEPSAPAHYDFGYAVSDPLTGDSKTQQESRRGDVVHGSYSLLESDGTKRTVEYTADDHNGFNAVVHKDPVAVHAAPVVAKVAAPAIVAAPVAHTAYAAPVAHAAIAAPVAHTGYAGSIAHGYAAPTIAHGYAAPSIAHGYAAPAIAHGYAAPTIAHGYAAAAPVAHTYAAHHAPAW